VVFKYEKVGGVKDDENRRRGVEVGNSLQLFVQRREIQRFHGEFLTQSLRRNSSMRIGVTKLLWKSILNVGAENNPLFIFRM